MLQKLNSKKSGFTLVEIMIVVAIIALLAAIAVPNFLRARKRSQATRILEDLRELDHAVDEYAIDNGKSSGVNPTFEDLQPFIKTGTVLYSTGTGFVRGYLWPLHGGFRGAGARCAYTNLSDVAPATFWSPYITP